MVRTAVLLALVAAPALAHGGAFRPPPRRQPAGDTIRPRPRSTPTTANSRSVGTPLQPWEYWWRLNREPYLRLRQRIEERTVISGTRAAAKDGDERFDRRKLRDDVLLPVMLRALDSPDEEIRTSAAVALGKFRATKTLPRLLDAMRGDRAKQVREAAMLGLVHLRDPRLQPELRRIALDAKQDRRLRVWAVLGLGFLKDAEFLTRLVSGAQLELKGAGSTVDEMRACAALALGFAESPAAVAPLVSASIDKAAHQDLRGYAGCSIGRLGNPLAEPEMLGLIDDRRANRLARYGAAIALGRLIGPGRHDVIDRLGKKAGRDKDRSLRTLLVMSLGRIGGDRAARHLVAAHRQYTRNQGFIYLALGISRSDDAGDVLMQLFEKLKNPNDRGACALGLALAGHKKAARMLREHVKRGNPGFVPHGMVALGILDDRKAIPLVQEILEKNPDPVMRREGAFALALLRRQAAVPELVALLNRSKSTFTRGAVASALGMIGNVRAVDPLLEIYRDKSRQSEERAIALAALGRIGDLDELPLLSRLAVDLNPYVYSDAITEALRIL